MKFTILLILFVVGCSHFQKKKSKQMKKSQSYTFTSQEGALGGGHSGLFYKGKNKKGELIFWTHTDRGPNAEPIMEGKKQLRPFVEPKYQPRLIKFKLNPKTKSLVIVKEIPLSLPDGSRFTGLPNFLPRKNRTGDEIPVDLKLKRLPLDNMGIDPEALCFSKENIWLSEEYGPSILKFDLKGKLETRFVPKGYYSVKELKTLKKKYGKKSIQDVLPENFMKRKLNRGLEGLTCEGDKLYSALQSPLPEAKNEIVIIEFDLKREKVSREISYTLASKKADKIGDMVISGDKLYVIEQNSETGPNGIHHIYESHLIAGKIVNKKLLVDLVKMGFDFEKIEGLTLIDKNTFAIVNDNDFALKGTFDKENGKANFDQSKTSVLGLIKLK